MSSTALTRAQAACRAAFTLTLLIFLALASVLVGVQILGLVLVQPGWISWASDALFTPSIGAAVLFGLVAFVSGYLNPGASEE
ncbi:hypothetical protein [Saccharopolyspora flava]|uniref:Uncharacterized protein n=1 Tax=Saccharopolyspora flava TaxID=95161 RepID=A0A1I6SAC3_9PSEU|nr:hypothetical protein [Saccharopolyspora flava]SFS73896.1 hypothetical protein SAMN05660874_03035 [Saccharopolyspora flava]